MKTLLTSTILLVLITSFASAQNDTVYVSEKNKTYIEFEGQLILCDIGISEGEQKEITKSGGSLKLKTDSYSVQVSTGNTSGIAIILANKKGAESTELFIKTTTGVYKPLLVYKDLENQIGHYDLDKVSPKKNNTHNTINANEGIYAEVTGLPDKYDPEASRELLKYNPSLVRDRIKTVETKKDKYQDVGQNENGILTTLEGLFVDNTHFYIKIKIENHTTVDYRLEKSEHQYIKVTKDRFLAKKLENPEDLNNVIKDEANLIKGNNSAYYVYAVPIFALDNKSYLFLQISEFQGKRQISLKIPAKKINQSIKLI